MIKLDLDNEFYYFDSKDIIYFKSYKNKNNMYSMKIVFKYNTCIIIEFSTLDNILYHIDLLKNAIDKRQ